VTGYTKPGIIEVQIGSLGKGKTTIATSWLGPLASSGTQYPGYRVYRNSGLVHSFEGDPQSMMALKQTIIDVKEVRIKRFQVLA
jgi:hypothetical protein